MTLKTYKAPEFAGRFSVNVSAFGSNLLFKLYMKVDGLHTEAEGNDPYSLALNADPHESRCDGHLRGMRFLFPGLAASSLSLCYPSINDLDITDFFMLPWVLSLSFSGTHN
jgi:hypothetical protein